LSNAFEVVAVLLRAPEETVVLRNDPGTDGAPFALTRVELNPEAELRALFVRAPEPNR
jgi:hypothetical protein